MYPVTGISSVAKMLCLFLCDIDMTRLSSVLVKRLADCCFSVLLLKHVMLKHTPSPSSPQSNPVILSTSDRPAACAKLDLVCRFDLIWEGCAPVQPHPTLPSMLGTHIPGRR